MALTLKALQLQIDSLKEEIAQLKASEKQPVIKKNLGIGDTFELLDLTWTILDITDKGYMCLASRFKDDMQFDSSSNDWKISDLRECLNNEFYEELAEIIGADNIIPFERDLLSLDGLTEYGNCEDKISLLTIDDYRKYRAFIPNSNDYYWLLLTADSCKSNNDNYWVHVVSPRGYIDDGNCNDGNGVRPVCILKSNIFVSKGE